MPPDYMMVLQLEQYNLQYMLYELAWRPTWDVIIGWVGGGWWVAQALSLKPCPRCAHFLR